MQRALGFLTVLVSTIALFAGCSSNETEPEAKVSSDVIAVPRDVAMQLQDRVVPVGEKIWFRAEQGNPQTGYTSLIVDLDDPMNDEAAVALFRDKLAQVDRQNPQATRIVYGHMEGSKVVAGAGIFYSPPPLAPNADGTMRLVIKEDGAINSLADLVKSGNGFITFSGWSLPVSDSTGISGNVEGSFTSTIGGNLEPTEFQGGFEARDGKLAKVKLKASGAMKLWHTLQSQSFLASIGATGDKYRLARNEKQVAEYVQKFYAQAGPVPVFGEVKTTASIGWELGATGRFMNARVTHSLEGALDVEAECALETGCELRVPVQSLKLIPEIQGAADVKAAISAGLYVKFKVQLLLYMVAGPEIALHAPWGRVASIYRNGGWTKAWSIGGQIRGGLSFFGVGPSWDGPLCNFVENGDVLWKCYGTQSHADDALLGGIGEPNRTLYFPAMFDNAWHGVHPGAGDRLASVLSVQNPTGQRTTVRAIARDDDGRILSGVDMVIDPNATIEISSVDGSRNGQVFTDATRGKRFSLELIPDDRVVATAVFVRIADDGRPRGTADRPAQLASVRAIEAKNATADVVFSQMPNRGPQPADWMFASEAYLFNPSDERAQVQAILRCPITGATPQQSRTNQKLFVALPHQTTVVRAHEIDREYSARCTLHLRTSDDVRLVASSVWSNAATRKEASALHALNGVARGGTSFVPTRVQWHRTGFDSGIQVMNVSDRSANVVLSFDFPKRTRFQKFQMVRSVVAGDVFSVYMGVPSLDGIPEPGADEEREARDGTVTVTSDQPVVANVNVDNRTLGGAWTVIPPSDDELGTKLQFPGLFQSYAPSWVTRAGGSDAIMNSGLTLTNASSTENNSCRVDYLFGGETRTIFIDLAPRQSLNHFLPNADPISNGAIPAGRGSAVVTCTRPAAGEISMRMSNRGAPLDWLVGDACDSTSAFIEP